MLSVKPVLIVAAVLACLLPAIKAQTCACTTVSGVAFSSGVITGATSISTGVASDISTISGVTFWNGQVAGVTSIIGTSELTIGSVIATGDSELGGVTLNGGVLTATSVGFRNSGTDADTITQYNTATVNFCFTGPASFCSDVYFRRINDVVTMIIPAKSVTYSGTNSALSVISGTIPAPFVPTNLQMVPIIIVNAGSNNLGLIYMPNGDSTYFAIYASGSLGTFSSGTVGWQSIGITYQA